MRFRAVAALALAVALGACLQRNEPLLNPLAERYVRLSLEIGTHEPGYVDAYYGPPQWKTEAEAHPHSIAELKRLADGLHADIQAAEVRARDPLVRRRAHVMAVYVASARFRLDMLDGVRLPYADEAERLFALRPERVDLASFDPVLARIDALVPGPGPLADRVEAFQQRYVVPSARWRSIMTAAIVECRARTEAHIALPEHEQFTLEFVHDEPWGAYNWYQGDDHSVIEVNTDLPLRVGTALIFGCHEGYPGHHVQGIFAERLYRERGWLEYSISPLFSPQGPLNEGAGNYGVDMAYPGDERLTFFRNRLFPLAGLDPSTAQAYFDMQEAMRGLSAATRTVAAMYLDGELDREHAITLMQRYTLSSRESAEKAIQFAEHYRSYTINYSSGEDLIRAYVERAGDTPEARWAAYQRILETPTLPSDLTP